MAETTITPRTSTRLSAAERRRQLAETAAQLFYRRGFHGMALTDVSSKVGVTAPALYRHFRNKKALLAGAIDSGLDVVFEAVDAAGPSLDDLLDRLAGAALKRRDLWVLLQREMRHLDEADREPLQDRFGAFVTAYTDAVRSDRGETDEGQLRLVVAASIATLASAAISGLRMPRERYRRVLATAAAAAARAELPEPVADNRGLPKAATDSAAGPRSEQLLQTAIRLFHERGYSGVSLDDIGAAVGMAGPSIYHHFATKSELLETAFTRAVQRLPMAHETREATPSLDELVDAYIEAGVQHRLLFGVFVTESINLPREARVRISAQLRGNAELWTSALRAARPELDEMTSAALVHAARAIVNDVVRVGHLHERPAIVFELRSLTHAVLQSKPNPTDPTDPTVT